MVIINLNNRISMRATMRRYSVIYLLEVRCNKCIKNIYILQLSHRVSQTHDAFLCVYSIVCYITYFFKHHHSYTRYGFQVFALPNAITCFTLNIYMCRKFLSFTAILLLSSRSDKLPYSCRDT